MLSHTLLCWHLKKKRCMCHFLLFPTIHCCRPSSWWLSRVGERQICHWFHFNKLNVWCFHSFCITCTYCKLSYCCYCEMRTVSHHLYVSKEQAHLPLLSLTLSYLWQTLCQCEWCHLCCVRVATWIKWKDEVSFLCGHITDLVFTRGKDI